MLIASQILIFLRAPLASVAILTPARLFKVSFEYSYKIKDPLNASYEINLAPTASAAA